MFSHKRKARVLFGLADIVVATLAFEIAYQTRQALHWHFLFFLTVQQKTLVLGFSLLALVTIGVWLRVYEKLDSGDVQTIARDSARQCVYAAGCLLLFQYALRMDLSRFFLGLYASLTWALLLVFRLTAGRVVGLVRREFAEPHFVMVVGTGERAQRIAQSLERSTAFGVLLRGFFAESEGASTVLNLAYPVHPLAELPMILRKEIIDEIIFAVDSRSLAELEEVFLLCDQEGVRTRVAVDFFPHVNSSMSLDHLDEIPLLTFSATPHDELRLLVKRTTDLAIAGVGLLVLAPLLLIVSILVRSTSPGPVLFRQVRCGLNGRRFVLYKFRSMCENAEALKDAVAHLNTRQTAFKIPDDPRTTTLGRYLRKFSIDEWPQLWNVLRGDMSLVGPRPAVPSEVEHYQRWQRRRLRMRPGLTCLWAVSGRDHVDFDTWMKLDMQYIDHWSLGLDWKILLRTIPLALMGQGAS